MNERTQEFRVGVVALMALVITVLLVALNTGTAFRLTGAPYPIEVRVDRAPGVGVNTPVRKDGVLIGRVASTDFLADGGVLVRMNIEPGAPIYQTDACRVQPSSLFGDAVINFSNAGGLPAGSQPQPLEAGMRITGMALPDPIEALTSLQVDVGPAIASIGEAADGVASLTNRINESLGKDAAKGQVDTLVDDARTAMDQFTQTMALLQKTAADIDALVNDPVLREGLDSAARDVPALLAEARSTVQRAEQTLSSFSGVVQSAENNLENLEGLTKPLGDRGPELAQLAISAVERLDATLTEAQAFVRALSESEGTIGRLVNDPALYDNVSTLMKNANLVLAQIYDRAKELRAPIYDARVFMDKIARNPGSIVRGALNEGPHLK
ncbi:MlaD family protein [Botrimarina hoheduenensis]|uniref:Mce related protein n=1 Tax=Botrimarina hoheduenensis TaxID=2528000 RepID=A0A5C5WE67_9BACT|nr:MlaD family protein [Botrimarina hoheduenensis]TWT48345.1 mce related protein [Botrimarina hoheduenensis]